MDRIRIGQVISALLSNVIKYSIPGKILITCHLINGDIRMTVEDEGQAFNYRSALPFLKRFIVQALCVRKTDGSGLGLAVVSYVARAHGGQVCCKRSALGGCCIEFILPADVN